MNKKKFLIGLIVILVVAILLCLTFIFFKKQQNLAENTFETATFDLLEENVIPENEIIDVTIAEVVEEITPEGNTNIQENIETKVDTASQKSQSSPIESSNTKQEQLQVNQGMQTKIQTQPETKIVEPAQNQVQTEQTKITEENKEVITPPSQSTTQITKDEEKYVRNDAMINRIKEVIQSNESEYMKTYGYTIVVDSSIKEQANQFTFTETRVKSYITYRFGTIKIYAEDYYRNGQLIMTECYIF